MDFPGSDIVDKAGWDESSMMILMARFLSERGLVDDWLHFLNDCADAEAAECEGNEDV